jgi:chromosome segregation ATPase
VEALEERLRTAVSAVEASQQALESVQNHSERIPDAIKPLEPVLAGLHTQTRELEAQLEAIAALRDKAIDAFPVIQTNLEKITTDLTNSVDRALARSQQALQDAEASHTRLQAGYESFLKDAGEARERFAAELTTTLKQMSEQSAQEFARHGELIESAAKEAQKAINEAWGESVSRMNEQFEKFDDQMQQELNRALQSLGRNLASVSEKFVSDYTPLTDRLRDLVETARRAG